MKWEKGKVHRWVGTDVLIEKSWKRRNMTLWMIGNKRAEMFMGMMEPHILILYFKRSILLLSMLTQWKRSDL